MSIAEAAAAVDVKTEVWPEGWFGFVMDTPVAI